MSVPLGLLYVGTVLRRDGFSVRLCDFQTGNYTVAHLEQWVSQADRVMVGFTCDAENIFTVQRICDRILRINPDLLCFLGGPQITGQPTRYARERVVAVCGEGEHASLLLARWYFRGVGSIESVPSISYVTHDGKVHSNKEGLGLFDDMSEIPILDWSLLAEPTKYNPCVNTSRGCPYRCRFCVEGSRSTNYRERDLDSVRKELETLREIFGDEPVYLHFSDDTFTAYPDRVQQICHTVKTVFGDKEDFGFYCEGRANVLAKHTELLAELKSAGLVRLQIGIESASDSLLRKMNKNICRAEIEQVVHASADTGICSIFGAFIVGLPEQTQEDVEESLEFAKHLADISGGRFESDVAILTPFLGTDYYENRESFGLSIFDPDFITGTTVRDCFAETRKMNRETIERLCNDFEEAMRRYLWGQLEYIEPAVLKQMINVNLKLGMSPLPVRNLLKQRHGQDLLSRMRSSKSAFLEDMGGAQKESLCPARAIESTSRQNDCWIINEKSPLAFVLTELEMHALRYFTGKLTFMEIAKRIVSQGIGDSSNKLASCQATLDWVISVYRKCEDKFAASTLEV